MIRCCCLMEKQAFAEWLRYELEKRDWSQSDLSRISGISPTQIGRIFSGERNLGLDSLVALAKALTVSPMVIIRKIGLLPNGNGDQVKFEDWEHLLKQMSAEDESELRQIAELKIERRKKDQSLKSLKPKRAG